MSLTKNKTSSVSSLDYNEAMTDFATMFPNEDFRIIDAVLRSNDGVVDSTVDQLLSLDSATRRIILHQEDKHPCNDIHSCSRLSLTDSLSFIDPLSTSSNRQMLVQKSADKDCGNMRACDCILRRALGSFSSASSNPFLSLAVPTPGSNDVIRDAPRPRSVASVSSLLSCTSLLMSQDDSIVTYRTPFSLPDTKKTDDAELLAAPASLHRHQQSAQNEHDTIPVVNVFQRSTVMPLQYCQSANDCEVFLH